MASADKELEEQLREAGSKLVDPPSSIDELLPLFDIARPPNAHQQEFGADALRLRKSDSDPDSNGAVSALDSEHAYYTQHSTSATDFSIGEVWSAPVCDV